MCYLSLDCGRKSSQRRLFLNFARRSNHRAKSWQYITTVPFNEGPVIRPGGMEDQVIKAKVNILLDKLDMIFRVSRDAGNFLDGIWPNSLAILLRHLRSVDLLIIHKGPCPVFPASLNSSLRIPGILDHQFDQPGHLSWILTRLATAILKILAQLALQV